LLTFLNVEINPDPTQHRPVGIPDGFGPAEKPTVSSVGAAYPKTHLASVTGAQAVRPDSSCLVTIIRMQESDVKVPLLAGALTGTERMIFR
jgi:hypothetical protein